MILFSMKCEFRNTFFVAIDLKVLHDLWRTWIINWYSWFHHSILHAWFSGKSSEWLEATFGSDLGSQFAIWRFDSPSHLRFYFLHKLLLVWEQFIKKSILLAYFCDLGKWNFYIRDSWSFIFSFREPCQRTPCTTLITGNSKIATYH